MAETEVMNPGEWQSKVHCDLTMGVLKWHCFITNKDLAVRKTFRNEAPLEHWAREWLCKHMSNTHMEFHFSQDSAWCQITCTGLCDK